MVLLSVSPTKLITFPGTENGGKNNIKYKYIYKNFSEIIKVK